MNVDSHMDETSGQAREVSSWSQAANMKSGRQQAVRPTSNPARRRFLKLATVAALAGAALPKRTHAFINPIGGLFHYTGGVVFNTELPGPAGELTLNIYLAVDNDGTGLGTLSDVIHPEINSHLAITDTTQHGNTVRFEGVVLASNTAARVGRPFVAAGVATNEFTSLALVLDDGTFTGKGFLVSVPKFIDPTTHF